MSETPTLETTFLKNLWDDREAAALDGEAARAAALPFEPARRGSPHHELRRRQHELEVRPARSADRRAAARDGGQGQRRRPRVDRHVRASPCSTWTSSNDLVARYRGEAHEDEMVGFYPLCAFGENRVAASIDTALHAFLPFPHVDHLHPDWAIALAASANGKQKLDEFNKKYGRQHRVGAVAAARVRAGADAAEGGRREPRAATASCSAATGCSRGARRSSEALRQQHQDHRSDGRVRAGSREARRPAALRRRVGDDRRRSARRSSTAILPYLRGAVSSNRRVIAHYDGGEDAIAFANSTWAESLCQMGTSCPDHFLRTRISPLYVPFDAGDRRAAGAQGAHRRAARAVPPGLRRLLQGACAPRFAGAARFESVGRGRFPGSGCSASARTSARRASRRSSSSTPFT